MVIENRTVRVVLVSLLVLLVIPLLVMAGMMMFGGGMMSGMMGQMSGMQMGNMHMSAGFMALCVVWALLVSAALITLIVLLVRGTRGTPHRDIPSADMRSRLAH